MSTIRGHHPPATANATPPVMPTFFAGPARWFRCAYAVPILTGGLLLAPAASRAETLMDPYLQAAAPDGISVLVECDSAGPVTVDYGPTEALGATAATAGIEPTTAGTQMHRVRLAGLSPNTRYYYRARHGTSLSPIRTFRTLVETGRGFRFAVMGDCRSGPAVHDAIALRIKDTGPLFSLYGGDLCNDPAYATWKKEFFRPNELALAAEVPFFNVPGNHEKWEVNTRAFMVAPASLSGTPAYASFDCGDAHFLLLNNELPLGADSPQYAFAREDLARTTQPWKIVVAHRPAFSSGKHGNDPAMQALTREVFEPAGVALVLAGHDHNYQHNLVRGLHHFVLGGGGAYLTPPAVKDFTVKAEAVHHFAVVDVTGTTLRLAAYREDGSELETLDLRKDAPPSPPPPP